MSTGVRWTAAVALAVATFLPSSARASEAPLSSGENTRLMQGWTVSRAQTLDRDDRHYVGGVAYAVVDAKSDELATIFEDVNAYRAILPHTKDARVVGRDGGDLLVELTQGTVLFDGTFTIRIRKEGRSFRFWLDRALPHDIEDAWGFFRWEPLAQVTPHTPRALLTYGILVDLGPGLVRDLFEDRIQGAVLTVPARVRDYVAREIRRTSPRA